MHFLHVENTVFCWKINICLSYRWHVAVGFKLERKKRGGEKKEETGEEKNQNNVSC